MWFCFWLTVLSFTIILESILVRSPVIRCCCQSLTSYGPTRSLKCERSGWVPLSVPVNSTLTHLPDSVSMCVLACPCFQDVLGFNSAGLQFLQREMESKEDVMFFADATERFIEKRRKRRKRERAVLTITWNNDKTERFSTVITDSIALCFYNPEETSC